MAIPVIEILRTVFSFHPLLPQMEISISKCAVISYDFYHFWVKFSKCQIARTLFSIEAKIPWLVGGSQLRGLLRVSFSQPHSSTIYPQKLTIECLIMGYPLVKPAAQQAGPVGFQTITGYKAILQRDSFGVSSTPPLCFFGFKVSIFYYVIFSHHQIHAWSAFDFYYPSFSITTHCMKFCEYICFKFSSEPILSQKSLCCFPKVHHTAKFSIFLQFEEISLLSKIIICRFLKVQMIHIRGIILSITITGRFLSILLVTQILNFQLKCEMQTSIFRCVSPFFSWIKVCILTWEVSSPISNASSAVQSIFLHFSAVWKQVFIWFISHLFRKPDWLVRCQGVGEDAWRQHLPPESGFWMYAALHLSHLSTFFLDKIVQIISYLLVNYDLAFFYASPDATASFFLILMYLRIVFHHPWHLCAFFLGSPLTAEKFLSYKLSFFLGLVWVW